MSVIGAMKDWTCWDRLPKIKTRTLFMAARYDTMQPSDMKRAADLVNGSEYWCSETGSHCCMYDDQVNYMTRLLQFILKQ